MHAGHFFKINSRRQEQLEKGYVGSHITYSRRVHVLLYICTSPAVQCVLLVPQGPSGPIGWLSNTRTAAVAAPTAVPTIIDIFFHTGTGVIFTEEDLNEANVPCDQE